MSSAALITLLSAGTPSIVAIANTNDQVYVLQENKNEQIDIQKMSQSEKSDFYS